MPPRPSQRRPSSNGKPKFKPIKPPKPAPSPCPSALSLLLRYFLPMLLLLILSLFYFQPFSDSHPRSVYSRGLVTSDLSYKDVLYESGGLRIDPTKKRFNASVLAYVTPWNSNGYDMAKLYRDKFTYVSPVWYQLKCGDNMQLHGRHDVDQNWINAVRIEGRPMILPRVTLEGWPLDTMLVQQDKREHAMNIISTECKTMQYDGVVLEAWSAWAVNGILGNPILRKKALHFVRDLGSTLHKVKLPRPQSKLQLLFVIPPPSKKIDANQFTAADMTSLGNSVDGYSLMTYDFSNPYHPGPNAPFPWVRACLHLLLGNPTVERANQQKHLKYTDDAEEDDRAPELLMGLNFYGNDFILPQGGGPIISHEYVSLLRKHKPMILWDDEAKEHLFEYLDGKKQHLVYYPSLKSLALRLEEANNWGAGISIWEIGQGLEYFFDLL